MISENDKRMANLIPRIEHPLTRREWFAGLAMQGLLANPHDEVMSRNIPADAIGWADALIAELEKDKP